MVVRKVSWIRYALRRVWGVVKNGLWWSLGLFALVMYLMSFGVEEISTGVSNQQLEMIANAVRRSAVQCYALEGSYPETLDYLVDEYSLQYDSQRYVVHYRSTGGNLLPEISVFHLT